MKRSRVIGIAICLLLCFAFIWYTLADIQLLSTESYGKDKTNLLDNSVSQRSTEISLSSGRGIFLDYKGNPLHNVVQKDVVIFPFITSVALPSAIKNELVAIDPNWKQKLQRIEDPIYLSELFNIEMNSTLYDSIEQASVPGLIAVERTIRKDPNIASHLIGFVRSNPTEYQARYGNDDDKPIGIAGLEKTFDSFLQSKNEEKLMYHVDAKGSPLFGLSLRYQGRQDHFYPLKIQTTLDTSIQETAERVVNRYNLEKGGLVLLDVETRNVLAMVSRPNIDENQPYLNNAIDNQMLKRHYPGSVFKTVVAAAAIEEQLSSLDKTYDCNLNLYGDGVASRQLGPLNFAESFAESCNYTFAKIGNELVASNPDVFDTYAKKLGLIETTGWSGDLFHFDDFSQFPEEEEGVIWGNNEDHSVPRAIAQTSVGQKEVKVTPLAVANMAATIAQNGLYQQVRVVDKILYDDGTVMREFDRHQQQNDTDTIKKETASQLQQLMEGVVDSGTGSSLQDLPIAGKSGTAETGIEGKTNRWFVGYFPRKNPKYAMVVIDLRQTSGEAQHYNIYHDVANELLDSE